MNLCLCVLLLTLVSIFHIPCRLYSPLSVQLHFDIYVNSDWLPNSLLLDVILEGLEGIHVTGGDDAGGEGGYG